MEVEEIQTQGCKFPRIGNGTSRGSDHNKLGQNGEEKYQDDEEDGEVKRIGGNGSGGSPFGGSGRVYGWPSSRIVRVSRASGGKDRHSKVWTSQGLRDRRIRLSVSTAIQFYDLQDRLGLDQPSKAVEWLLKAAAKSIDELRSIDTSFPDTLTQLSDEKRSSTAGNNDHHSQSAELELDCDPKYQQQKQQHNSSASETSKGSSLSLSSRSENRIKARERARERKAEREKEKESNVNPIAQSSFTELLTGGINNVNSNNNSSGSPNGSAQQNHSGSGEVNLFQKSRHWSSSVPMDYFAHHSSGFSQQIHLGNSLPVQSMSISPFSVGGGDQHFSFDPGNLIPVAASTASGGGGDYNLNFSISSGLAGLNRGTLQSNSPSMLSHLQRLSPIDGPNVPFFIGTAAPNAASVENHHHHHQHHNHNHQFPAGFDGCLQLRYGDGGRNADQKGKGKN